MSHLDWTTYGRHVYRWKHSSSSVCLMNQMSGMRTSHVGLREAACVVRTAAGAYNQPRAATATAMARRGRRRRGAAVVVQAVDGNDYQTLLVASTAAVAVGTSLYLGLQVRASAAASSSSGHPPFHHPQPQGFAAPDARATAWGREMLQGCGLGWREVAREGECRPPLERRTAVMDGWRRMALRGL